VEGCTMMLADESGVASLFYVKGEDVDLFVR